MTLVLSYWSDEGMTWLDGSGLVDLHHGMSANHELFGVEN